MSTVTLYQGDCLDILPTLEAGSVDAVVTDPPYGINTKSDKSGKLNPWADLCNAAFWYTAWFKECRRVLKPTGCFWSFLNWRSFVTFQKAACDAKWPIESLLVWDKEWIGPGGPRGLRPSYEFVALWAMPEFAIADRGIPDIRRAKWSSYKPNGHPAEKPEALIRWLIHISTCDDFVILDPFMGSGTTGAEAVRELRNFIGIEIDEQWFSVAQQRIAKAQAEMVQAEMAI